MNHYWMRKRGIVGSFLAAAFLLCGIAQSGAYSGKVANPPPAAISKAAAKSCAAKVKKLEEFSLRPSTGKTQTTRFSEEEINSYLALDLSSKFSPSLKSLILQLEEGKLQGNAIIDFDRLEITSTEIATQLFAVMLSGVHELMARGSLPVNNGKGSFQLEEAQFDGIRLPVALVREIITLIGSKQSPPFDPMSPSEMIYNIQRLDLHPGYMIVYQ
jgi:hypothetical protein